MKYLGILFWVKRVHAMEHRRLYMNQAFILIIPGRGML